jgi:hypothetical protein
MTILPAAPPTLTEPAATAGRAEGLRKLHTLGPDGTSCVDAARDWLERHAIEGELHLHSTMDAGARAMVADCDALLLSDVAYPELHNIDRLRLVDVFLTPIDDMVLASATAGEPLICATPPTMQDRVPRRIARRHAASSLEAAHDCVAGLADGCLTSLRAARRAELRIIRRLSRNGYGIHRPRSLPQRAGSGERRHARSLHASNGETR